MCSRMDVLYGYGVTVEPGPAMQTVAEYQRDYNRMLSGQIELLEKNPHAGNKIREWINQRAEYGLLEVERRIQS